MTVRRMTFSLQLGLLFAVLAPGLARADWAYTRWGMTPEQVAAASGGQVKVLPSGQRTRDEADDWEIAAQGFFDSAGQHFPAGFMFGMKQAGLKCVAINGAGATADALKADTISRYGKPAEENEFFGNHSFSWKAPETVQLMTADKAHTAVVTICRPGAED